MTEQGGTVRIERLVYGGSGLARTADGAVLFVPFVLPSELVEIQPAETENEAALVKVIEPARARVTPPCPHFGRCGGCQYQHATYDAQLEIKKSILSETMQRAGVDDIPAIQLHAGEPWQYRNRIRLRLGIADGQLRAGYSVRGSNEFLPIVECPIAAPLLWTAAIALLEQSVVSAEARAWLESADEVEFFCNEDSARLQMTLLFSRATPARKDGFARLCREIKDRVPQLIGAGVMPIDANRASVRLVRQERWEAGGLAYRVADEGYWVSRGGFFQVNRFLIEDLVRLVCDGRNGSVAWDLFAGVGLFSRVLAQSFAHITAVEANPSAAGDLRAALATLDPHHRAVQASTLDFLRGAVVQRERPELIVLDPPRAGTGTESCELLLRLRAPQIVYVSCDPTTLARDLVVLQRSYEIASMHLVDLFPQTFHMETVVVLHARE